MVNIDSNIFKGLIHLDQIYLHENKIVLLDLKIFSDLTKIDIITLYENTTKFISYFNRKIKIPDALEMEFSNYEYLKDFDQFLLQFEQLKSKNTNFTFFKPPIYIIFIFLRRKKRKKNYFNFAMLFFSTYIFSSFKTMKFYFFILSDRKT